MLKLLDWLEICVHVNNEGILEINKDYLKEVENNML